MVLDADDVGAMSKWVKLWENPSLTSDFGPQTITLPNNSCELFYIRFVRDNRVITEIIAPTFIKVGETSYVEFMAGNFSVQSGSIIAYSRQVTAQSATQITFGTGYIFGAANDTRNDLTIPFQIYGITGLQ